MTKKHKEDLNVKMYSNLWRKREIRKAQYCKTIHPTQLYVEIQCGLNQNSNKIFSLRL